MASTTVKKRLVKKINASLSMRRRCVQLRERTVEYFEERMVDPPSVVGIIAGSEIDPDKETDKRVGNVKKIRREIFPKCEPIRKIAKTRH